MIKKLSAKEVEKEKMIVDVGYISCSRAKSWVSKFMKYVQINPNEVDGIH